MAKTQKDQIDEAMKQFEETVQQQVEKEGLPLVPDMKTGAMQYIDMRELSLRFQISVENLKPFFDGLKEGKLMTTKCEECDKIFFPPQNDCPSCHSEDLEWEQLPERGELLTYTQINVKPVSFAHYDDYVVGVVKLGDAKVTAWIREEPQNLEVGQDVELVIEKREPENNWVYEFEPLTD